jgi:hypothetical protein
MRSILQAGVCAPSADNHHCFELEVSSDRIALSGNAEFLKAPYHRKILSLISFGAVAESMIIRAAALGYRANADWQSDPFQSGRIVELRLTRTEPCATALDSAIEQRHTNRRVLYSGPSLSPADLAQFGERLHGLDSIALKFFDSPPQRSDLLRLVGIAEAERFNTRALHDDLFSSIRFDVGWHSSTDDGLPPAVLGVEPGTRWLFAQLRRWPFINTLRHLGAHRLIGFRAAYLPCRMAPHRGVLTTSTAIEQGAVAAGRALQRIWLEAETRELAFQPLAGAALLALPRYRDVPGSTSERLRRGWKTLTDDTPVLVFRLGRAPRPPIGTSRRPVESYLRDSALTKSSN